MLKKFEVENYKNFKERICLDFSNTAEYQFSTDCITDGLISKMLIYGRNATGKTNLGNALMNICEILSYKMRYSDEGAFLNANSEADAAVFSYTFQFDEKEVIYSYSRLSNQELRDEKLIIDGITIFQCDFVSGNGNFENLKYIGAETVHIERYMQSIETEEKSEGTGKLELPFLRWLIGTVAFKNDSPVIKLADYVNRMVKITASHALFVGTRALSESFYVLLEKPGELGNLEEFLNIMGVECRLTLRKLPDGQRQLYFDYGKLIPFYENASSGTKALLVLYRRLITVMRDASFVYLDEFDAFYHYEMAENVIIFLKNKYPKCQIILTSHNTNLMTNRLMRPDCLFILSGQGTLTALCNATRRELREGHNLEKMYISGEFERYE